MITKEYFISYNDYDIITYDSDTTLVLGQMEKFYILNEDHRSEYSKLISNGKELLKKEMKNYGWFNKTITKIWILYANFKKTLFL